MKKFVIIAAVAACYLYLGSGTTQDEVPENLVESGGRVVLYSTAWCGWCQKTRELFADNNIRYVEYDIEKSEEHYRKYSDLGGQGIPMVTVGRRVIHGYDPDSILAAVGKD